MKIFCSSVTLVRDKRTGDYYSHDRKFFIEKGAMGWNLSVRDDDRSARFGYDWYDYVSTCYTLKEIRESIEVWRD